MSNRNIENYIQTTRLLSEQITKAELTVILRELQKVLDSTTSGNIVEFGCYAGTTSVHLQKFLQPHPQRTLWLYDSFEGLPEKTMTDRSPVGEQFVAGELHATKTTLIKNFKSANLPLPIIRKGWFADITPQDVPQHIAFAFLDGDYYDSILDPLKLIWPRLAPGAVVIVDDYMNEALPGAKKAVDFWLQNHKATLRSEASLAIIKT
jgi:O-methyltransferase